MELRTDLREHSRPPPNRAAVPNDLALEALANPARRSRIPHPLEALAQELIPEQEQALTCYRQAREPTPRTRAHISILYGRSSQRLPIWPISIQRQSPNG
jgi:hypothetical protein